MEDREDEAFRAADQALLAKEVESRILQKIFRRVGIDAEPDARIANELRSLVRIHQNRLHDRTRGGRRFELHGTGVPSQPRETIRVCEPVVGAILARDFGCSAAFPALPSRSAGPPDSAPVPKRGATRHFKEKARSVRRARAARAGERRGSWPRKCCSLSESRWSRCLPDSVSGS